MKRYYFAILTCATLLFGGNISASAAPPTFKDVQPNYWAQLQINYLADNSLVGGYSDGTFKPNDLLTRAQAAKMLVKAFKLPTTNTPNSNYKDVPTGHHGYKAIAAITDAGLMSGTKGSFRPEETLTRAQMAAILNTAFKLKEGSTYKSFKDVTKNHWAYNQIQMIASNRISTGYSDGTFRPSQPTTRAQFAVFLAVNLKPEIFQPLDREEVTRKANISFFPYGYVSSSGFVTSYGSWIYQLVHENPVPFMDSRKPGYVALYNMYRQKIDGSNKQKLTDDGEINLNLDHVRIVNGEIYYYHQVENKKVMKKMNLDGTNKQETNGPSPVSSKWNYTFEYVSDWKPDDNIERFHYDVYRTNTETNEKVKLNVVYYSRGEGMLMRHYETDKGIYFFENLDVNFVPINSVEPQKVDMKKKLIAFGFKIESIPQLWLSNLIEDRDTYYLLIEQRTTSKKYFIKFNSTTQEMTLIKELSKVNGVELGRLDNIYDGYGYFTTHYIEKQKAKIYRISLNGGPIQTLADLPNAHKYSLIDGKIYISSGGSIVKKIALPK